MPRRAIVVMGVALVLNACGDDAATNSLDPASATPAPRDVEIDASTPPDVDQSSFGVPLDEIVFDTFDGGFVRLPESTPALRGRLLDAIPPIDAPPYGDAATGDWLDSGDLVVGYVSGPTPYAYPIKILNGHEIVNDVIDGIPLLVSYCPLCRSAIVYDRRIEGPAGETLLSFSNTSALHESDMVMVDRQTGSYWWQVQGTAIVGSLTSTELTPLPSEIATWSDWRERHPDTLVLSRDLGFGRSYDRDSFEDYAGRVDAGRFAFPVESLDDRLPLATLVVAVETSDGVVVYPLDDLTEPVDDDVGGRLIRIDPHEGGATVYEIDSDGNIGSRVAARTAFWFAIAGAYPDVEIRG